MEVRTNLLLGRHRLDWTVTTLDAARRSTPRRAPRSLACCQIPRITFLMLCEWSLNWMQQPWRDCLRSPLFIHCLWPFNTWFLDVQCLSISVRNNQRVWWGFVHEQRNKLIQKKMSKKYEPTNVSEVEEHISLKYEIRKRLGKGVSGFFLFLI